jgi:hypothetical protein
MPGVQIEVDTRQLTAAIRYVFAKTQKTMPDIINRAALVTIIGGKGVTGAMQGTPKAARNAILAVPEYAIAAYVRKKHPGKMTRAQLKSRVKRERARRLGAIAYTAKVGWNKAAIALGGTGIGKRSEGRGYAALGYGKPATMNDPSAEGVNATPAASLIGEGPLQAALNQTSADIVQYAGGQIDEIIREAGLS